MDIKMLGKGKILLRYKALVMYERVRYLMLKNLTHNQNVTFFHKDI